MKTGLAAAPVESVEVSAYRIPTDFPEADGTFSWDATTLVLVELSAGSARGLGFSYTDVSAATFISSVLVPELKGQDAFAIPQTLAKLLRAVRNLGRPGVAACALSAVDIALWDLKAKLLGLPLFRLLGPARTEVPLYGSGGFTSYPVERLQAQLGGWTEQGFRRVKMKVGQDPEQDPARVRAARQAIGEGCELFVDGNGAYRRKQALALAERFAEARVTWFEEPVSSDDLAGLRLLRDRAPAGMSIAAGEYGHDTAYFQRMLAAGAVDVLQADATRCLGISGFLRTAALAEAFETPLSAHTAPSVHLHAACAAPGAFLHLEYFHDHARLERLLFDGVVQPVEGRLVPDPDRPGLGIELKRADAERFRIERT